jgi:glycosyltransferase involved in cell wall biosynthesis
VRLFLRREPGVEARLTHAPEGSQAEGGPVLIFRRWSSAAKAASQIATVDFELRLPPSFSAAAEESAVAALTTFLAHERACPPAIPADWRTDIRPQRNDLLAIYERLCGCGAVAPIVRPASSRGEIGFVIPIHSFGGVEKVVANQARVLRGLGFRTHLFVTSGESFLLTDETRESFTSVNLLMHPQFDRSSDVAHYFGAPISGFERREDATFRLDALGLLSGMDVVVDTHSLGAHSLAARLREWGVRTFTALHLVDRNSQGAPVGNPHIALAYEHAYDGVLVISQDLRAWCLAHGIPDEKIVLVRNAPSYVSTEPVETIRARRAARPAGPLRVLFLGRLDAQKGLDSLTDILTATRGASFAWRVVGKAVLASPDAPAFDPGVAVEPPVHDPASLDALYDGADVLVLPSRFEGAPLTILEARRRGVVVIANDVGAVSEVIGAGGYLVDASMGPQGVVAGFVRTLRALARDEELLHERVRLTLDEPPPTWEETMGEFIERLGSDGDGAQAVRVLSLEADSMRTP